MIGCAMPDVGAGGRLAEHPSVQGRRIRLRVERGWAPVGAPVSGRSVGDLPCLGGHTSNPWVVRLRRDPVQMGKHAFAIEAFSQSECMCRRTS